MPYRRHTITVATSALFFVCLVLHAQANLDSQTFPAYNNPEAYKVYESLLPTDNWIASAHPRRLLIQAQTSSPTFCLKPAPESAALLQPIFDAFVTLSKTTWLLQPNFRLNTPYEFVSSKDLQARSVHGYIILSPVAFNADKTIAVVSMGHECGTLCGGGTFHVLEKKDGIWKNMSWRGTACAWAS